MNERARRDAAALKTALHRKTLLSGHQGRGIPSILLASLWCVR